MAQPDLDFSSLRNAVALLEGALGVVGDSAWFDQQSATVRNTLVAGVIQNFEFIYELSIKMLRRTLEREADNVADIDHANFCDLLRIAGETGLVEDVEAWFGYRRMRNLSAHTYDQAKAWAAFQGTLAFIDDARSLLMRLEARHD
jgi:nucleotidyltransferase substrate binding protein (TIGR01987 family)